MFEDIIQKANAAIEAATPEHVQREREEEQKTKAWFEARMGFFNASDLPKLMTKGRGKDEVWGATAKLSTRLSSRRSMTPGRAEGNVCGRANGQRIPSNPLGNEHESAARQLLSEINWGGDT